MLVALLLAGAGPTMAASVPDGFLDQQVGAGFTSPSAMTVLPDGRVLVLQQDGTLRLIKNDVLAPAPFYSVASVDSFAERGCLGIVADPAFATNGWLYLYCSITDGSNSHNRLLRVTVSGDAVLPGSAITILDLPPIPAGTQWHMGGAMRFGSDGKLYVAVGGQEDERLDGAVSNSQNLGNPFGKILRINPDGSMPPDNPFYSTAGAYQGIYNYGLRNPFTFDIQPGTGRMYINDVGAGTWEEVNLGAAGANYGWPYVEGPSTDARFSNAIYEYQHDQGCAISGAAFYNPQIAQFPASYVGKFLFADFCNGWIRMLDPDNPAVATDFVSDIQDPVNIGIAPDGSLYYLARNQGTGSPVAGSATVGKISYTASHVPRITAQPQSQTIFLGDPVTFTVAADNAAGYQWLRNGVAIAGATGPSYTLAGTSAADQQAVFTALLQNAYGSVSSSAALLTITNNHLPVASIDTPAAGSSFEVGQTITFSGQGNDAEDGALAPAALSWRVDFQHDAHTHPFLATFSGASGGSFVASEEFEQHAANTWFRIYLTATDANQQTQVATRDIYPGKSIAELTPLTPPLNGLGPIEKDRSNGGAAAGDGSPITLGGIVYARGLGVHAPAELRYDLGGACSNGHFISDVGVDQAAGALGSVVFQAYLDGQKAFDSGLMQGGAPRQAINLPLTGVKELRLVVSDGGDGNAADLADWGAARVTRCQTAPAAASTAAAPAATGSSLAPPTGGGGCSIGGAGRFDPVLPLLLLLSVAWLAWRRARRRKDGK